MKINRRTFVKTAAASCAVGLIAPSSVGASSDSPVVYVVHGSDVASMLATGIEKFGGFARLIKKGAKVTLKVNAAWASLPDQGGNTNPDLVGACVKALKTEGAVSVKVPENPCSPAEKAFSMSGIKKAVLKEGGEMVSLEESDKFQKVRLKNGTILKTVDVATDILNTDFIINMPVVKSHGGCVMTCSMKNWMGSVRDRRAWHDMGVDRCIVDFNRQFKANLVIADATRVMRTEGPRGPGEVIRPGVIIFGTDPVAVDAYAAGLLNLKPFDIPHIKLAHDAGIGVGDLDKVEVRHLDVHG